jgi:hypothetical protein
MIELSRIFLALSFGFGGAALVCSFIFGINNDNKHRYILVVLEAIWFAVCSMEVK